MSLMREVSFMPNLSGAGNKTSVAVPAVVAVIGLVLLVIGIIGAVLLVLRGRSKPSGAQTSGVPATAGAAAYAQQGYSTFDQIDAAARDHLPDGAAKDEDLHDQPTRATPATPEPNAGQDNGESHRQH